jgi:hypothetical protein
VDKHSHKCGFGPVGFDAAQGCGHEWEHEDATLFVDEETYAGRHVCPECGKGPWTWKSNLGVPRTPDERDEEAAEMLITILRLIIGRNERCREKSL